MRTDEFFMKKAIELAASAAEHGNEPFGAVLVKDNEIVYTNENQIHTETDPTFHAEAGLIRNFCNETHIMDLHEYTLYSSCEPCFMCSGAMVWARLGRLVYGASNIDLCNLLGKSGSQCCQIVFENSAFKPEVTSGILRDESLQVLAGYFSKKIKS